MLYNNDSIPEANNFILEVLEDTYLNMEIALPHDSEGPEFAKLLKDSEMQIVSLLVPLMIIRFSILAYMR